MIQQLKPCPFCGGKNISLLAASVSWLYCNDCNGMGPSGFSESQAIKLWNTRVATTEDQSEQS